jgi:hypothetical protein
MPVAPWEECLALGRAAWSAPPAPLPLTYASGAEVSSAWSRWSSFVTGERGNRKRAIVQNGLYFFMMLGVGLIFALGAGVAWAVLADLREKLGGH